MMNQEKNNLEAAYAYCAYYTKQHTEHFPIRSFLLPKALCRSIAVIYTFARTADDLADENDMPPLERMAQLERYEAALRSLLDPSLRGPVGPTCATKLDLSAAVRPVRRSSQSVGASTKEEERSCKESSQKSAVSGLRSEARNDEGDVRNDNECEHLNNPVFIALGDLLKQYPLLDHSLLFDLLAAFKQDLIKNHYANKAEILDYCRRSANPVGRLLLHLSGQATPLTLQASDALCTALQLINFIHDIHPDFVERARCYMPHDTLEAMGLSTPMIAVEKPTAAVHRFIQAQLDEIESLLTEGSCLGPLLSGRFGFYTSMIIQSAYHMMHKLRFRSDLHQRLRFSMGDWIIILWRSIVERLKAW